MDDQKDIPKHIREQVERRWAQKLQEQALAWRRSRSEASGTTASGVQVVRIAKRSGRGMREKVA